jgi:hypothetical protein
MMWAAASGRQSGCHAAWQLCPMVAVICVPIVLELSSSASWLLPHCLMNRGYAASAKFPVLFFAKLLNAKLVSDPHQVRQRFRIQLFPSPDGDGLDRTLTGTTGPQFQRNPNPADNGEGPA